MLANPPFPLNIEIDKLTNSIENAITGEVFDTVVTRLIPQNEKQIKKRDWQFNWKQELKDPNREAYKLTTVNNPTIIQGLLSIQDKGDHVFMHLIESAVFNKGKDKVYLGVPGNLVAFACRVSLEKGYEGFISFIAKTALKTHYEQTLGAKILYGDTMVIDTTEALKLINRYFKS
ncbi:hypothetical protein [Larkinella humicola]|uniref:Uncharacterized protein n=1 Tax=Larkinella humicola TaxID=2607654 RepID=A0A5N1JDQ3_9BACT|nr:hypothetical protein [Larkinella humicola]KAA9353067.1 hypothetical protein F0P93_17990 [Larkinella humicola]